jgi:predicted nucleic acid-binding protein
LGSAYSLQWLAEMMDGVVLLNPEPADYSSAAALLARYKDHPVTLVDAVTAGVSRRLDIPVWTFDRHFATMRAEIWR